MTRTPLKERMMPSYTHGEEIFNMVTHIVGGGIGVATLVLGVIIAALGGNVTGVLCSIVFGVSMIALYSVSSIYHGLHAGMGKRVFQVLDHCTIYLLIAGTYTPFLLCSLVRVNPVAAWVTFGFVWGLTALAITLNAIDLRRYRAFSMICYVGIGWSIIFSISDMLRALGTAGFALLLGGGCFYTVGVIFYALGKKIRYFHAVFHIFVLLGSITQALSVLMYVL